MLFSFLQYKINILLNPYFFMNKPCILALRRRLPDVTLYLAMPQESYESLIKDDLLAEFLDELSLKYIIFDPETKQIVKWIS